MHEVSFLQRFGLETRHITDAFPPKARTALGYVVEDLLEKGCLSSRREVVAELRRVGGIPLDAVRGSDEAAIAALLSELEWHEVFAFCERLHKRLLQMSQWAAEELPAVDGASEPGDLLGGVRRYYSDEVNTILAEHGLAYEFVGGLFQRRGRAQTQKSLQRIGTVLSQPRLEPVRPRVSKAIRFFDTRPEPDTTNCVKEAVCALEACVEVVTGANASADFPKAVRKVQGIGAGQTAPTIAEGMIKLYAYRGSGQGVAHAALQGSPVSAVEAELVLNLVAAYVTYLADLFPEEEEEIPF